ncbi:MAG: (2Fe-2S)-binding protein [Deltaproteobacteria bacterium]|nr:(2Fe-2S)-binding protein [Deltaproteobacteria bacterium]
MGKRSVGFKSRKETSPVSLEKREALIKANYQPGCICKGIKLAKIMKAIDGGARSFKDIAKVTGIGNGSCESKRCGEKVEKLLNDS